jgi:hypothetical protein
MEAMYSSETPGEFQWTARRYVPEDEEPQILYSHDVTCKYLGATVTGRGEVVLAKRKWFHKPTFRYEGVDS